MTIAQVIRCAEMVCAIALQAKEENTVRAHYASVTAMGTANAWTQARAGARMGLEESTVKSRRVLLHVQSLKVEKSQGYARMISVSVLQATLELTARKRLAV